MPAERLDHFMARANAAYYAGRDPFADFTTSPEISQVFGEVLGLWAAVTWIGLGKPTPVLLIEAGPGRGTLMADALRAIRQAVPDFAAALQVHLIETSPTLRAVQATRIPDASWHESLDSVPETPFVLLANEFLDALPIRQFVRRGQGWAERWVVDGVLEERPAKAGVAMEIWHDPAAPPQEGAIRELSEPALAFVRSVAERLARRPGAALILDYGPEHRMFGDSLQALAGGRPADPLAAPGTADLTAHVDFSALADAAVAAGAAAHGPVPQGIFLARLGLFQRANRLARNQSMTRAAAIMEAARRLGEPDMMGRLFKALALTGAGAAVPAGFEA